MTAEIWAVVVSGLFLTGFAANEMTHGGVAEAMGMGHRHMMDHEDYHCAGPDEAGQWQRHVDHMHGGDPAADHSGCGATHQRMHEHAMRGMTA